MFSGRPVRSQRRPASTPGSTLAQRDPGLANLIGITPNELVYIAETCGGGFGSKGTEYPVMSIPAHMSKKIGRPVMLRITRREVEKNFQRI